MDIDVITTWNHFDFRISR